MVANIFACKVVRVTGEEAGAIGAALQALWCESSVNDHDITLEEITAQFVKLDEPSSVLPDPSIAAQYEEIYRKYLAVNEAISPLSKAP